MSKAIKTERIWVRIFEEDKAKLNEAASICNETLSDFVRTAALDKAGDVIAGEIMAICPGNK